MRWLADSRVTVLITDRPAHAVALRATLTPSEALLQADKEQNHLLTKESINSPALVA